MKAKKERKFPFFFYAAKLARRESGALVVSRGDLVYNEENLRHFPPVRGFYEKNGYAVFGQIADCPPGTILYYLKKSCKR